MTDQATPKLYRKKPVTIQAMLFTGDNANEIDEWINGIAAAGNWGHCDFWEIETMEGIMKAQIGDYIIRGVQGEFYPIKESIFRETYEKVNQND